MIGLETIVNNLIFSFSYYAETLQIKRVLFCSYGFWHFIEFFFVIISARQNHYKDIKKKYFHYFPFFFVA